LKNGNDDLSDWAKTHEKTLFIEPDAKVSEALRQIADFTYQRYDDEHWIRLFLNGADPWVIAQAKAYNLKLVTMEGKKSTEEINKYTKHYRGKIKIPNICDHFGVQCITTFDLLRTLRIGLG